ALGHLQQIDQPRFGQRRHKTDARVFDTLINQFRILARDGHRPILCRVQCLLPPASCLPTLPWEKLIVLPIELPNVTPTLIGNRVRLRAPHPDDRADRQRAGIHAEFRRMVGADEQVSGPISAEATERWYHETANAPCSWVIEV